MQIRLGYELVYDCPQADAYAADVECPQQKSERPRRMETPTLNPRVPGSSPGAHPPCFQSLSLILSSRLPAG
jgi:hypothetical protein